MDLEGGYSGIFKVNILLLIQKFTGLFPDGVTGIYLGHNPSNLIMALGSAQHLTEISSRNIALE